MKGRLLQGGGMHGEVEWWVLIALKGGSHPEDNIDKREMVFKSAAG
jgi:hypothetical protein